MFASRRLSPLLAAAVSIVVLSSPRAVYAEPSVAVVVLSHEGLTEDQADEIAAEVATAVQNRIEGTARSGADVREKLPAGGAEEGCEQKPDCGRALAKTLATDEVLLLSLRKLPHHITLAAHRVARDPGRAPTHAAAQISALRAKRSKVITESVAGLYAPGSVVAWVEPAPPPSSAAATGSSTESSAVEEAPATTTRAQQRKLLNEPRSGDEKPVYKKGWFIGVMIGAGALVVAGVVLGVALGIPPSPTAPSVTLP